MTNITSKEQLDTIIRQLREMRLSVMADQLQFFRKILMTLNKSP